MAEAERLSDVGIVGGGAAGLVTALTLFERVPDLDITIYEREPEAYTTLCGEGLSEKTLELFSAFDTREHCPQRFRGASWWFPGDVEVLVNEPCYTLERATWIPAMAEAFQAEGGTYQAGVKVTPDQVPELASEHDLLIGADGPGSQVRKHIGGEVTIRLGVQMRLKAPWEGDRLAFYTDKRFSPEYSWVFPKGDILNVGILGEADGNDWDRVDAFRTWVDARWGTDLMSGTIVKKEAYPIAFEGTRLAGENIVLTGDAAGITNPLTKGGLAGIIHASHVLADEVHQAIQQGRGGRSAAASYARALGEHPVLDPRYQEALDIILDWSNEDFESLTRFAPGEVVSGGPTLKRAALLALGMASNPRKVPRLWTLYKAMALSKGYSW